MRALFLLLPMAVTLAMDGRSQSLATVPDHVFVTGRCIDPDTGQPVAGCTVRVTGHQATGYDLNWAILNWFEPEPAISGPDGRVRVRIDWPMGRSPNSGYPCRIHVNASHPDRANAFNLISFPPLFEQGGLDWGDLEMPLGTRPAVRVVDEEGRPQANVLLTVRHESLAQVQKEFDAGNPGPWMRPQLWRRARTGDDGHVHWDAPLQAGKWALTVDNRKAIGDLPTLSLPETRRGLATVRVRTLERERVLSGKVLDTAGRPVSGLVLSVRHPGAREGEGRFVTQADGRFTIDWGKQGDEVQLVAPLGRRYHGWAVLGRYTRGTEDVMITLPVAMELTLNVRAGGKPVEEFTAVLRPENVESPLAAPRQRQGRFANGQLRVDRIYPGEYSVEIYPKDRRLSSVTVPVQVKRGGVAPGDTVRVNLQPSQVRTFELRHTGGGQVEGSTVELLFGPDPVELFAADGPVAFSGRASGNNRLHGPFIADRGATDAKGRVQLWAPEEERVAYLRILGPGHVPMLHPLGRWDQVPDKLTVIQVARSATLRGVVGPLARIDALDPTDPKELERHRKWGTRSNAWGESAEDLWRGRRLSVRVEIDGVTWGRAVPLDGKGRFDAGDVPPGRCRLLLVGKGKDGAAIGPVLLDELTLTAGGGEALECTLPAELREP